MPFKLPTRLTGPEGGLRRVGVELEFSGLSLASASEVIAKVTHGRWRQAGEYVCDIHSPLGDFKVEFDSSFFKKKKYEKYLDALGLNPADSSVGRGIKEAVERLGELVIPFEVVTPPLALSNLEVVEEIREELRLHCAKGTRSAPFKAFGLQFNPELPDFKSETIKSYLQAFFVLFDWLYEESDVPLARQLAPYIHPFPREYIELVADPDYQPDLQSLMVEYLNHNPTRNRPLDMLPLFSYLNRELVFSYPVEKQLVKSRPTFHYRLPNSEVDDFDWTIAREWNRWVEIEELANDSKQLMQICADFHLTRQRHSFIRQDWIRKTRERLNV